MQRYTQDAINSRRLLNIANGRIYNTMNDLTITRNELFRREQMLIQLWRNEADTCRDW